MIDGATAHMFQQKTDLAIFHVAILKYLKLFLKKRSRH